MAIGDVSGHGVPAGLVMMMVKHYLVGIPDTERLDAMLDRFYNMSFYESDHAGEGYRKVFVIDRERKHEAIYSGAGYYRFPAGHGLQGDRHNSADLYLPL